MIFKPGFMPGFLLFQLIMNIHTRYATAQDSDAIYRFICLLEDAAFGRVSFEKYYQAAIAQPNNVYLIAEADNKPIGFLSCHGQLLLHHMGWAYEIQELFVEEAYRSAGIGKKLVAALEAILDEREYDVLEVTSNVQRTAAHNFYLQNGFAQSHFKFTKKGTQRK